jgi:hypothetical protein
MPYKRRSRFSETFSIPQIWSFWRENEFFNTHWQFHQQQGRDIVGENAILRQRSSRDFTLSPQVTFPTSVISFLFRAILQGRARPNIPEPIDLIAHPTIARRFLYPRQYLLKAVVHLQVREKTSLPLPQRIGNF